MDLARIARQAACVIAAALLAFCLWHLFAGLAVNSFWHDEIFSMWMAEQPDFATMLDRAVRDTHPPTFYSILYGWTRISGFGEVGARLLPALCAAGALLAIMLLVRPQIGWPARLAAAALAASSLNFTEHAGEVRSYAPLMLVLAVAAAASGRLVARDYGRLSRKAVAAIFVISALLASALHLFAIYCVCWLCLILFVNQPAERRLAVLVLLGAMVILGIYAAISFTFYDHSVSDRLFAPSIGGLAGKTWVALRSGGSLWLLALVLAATLLALWVALRSGRLWRADAADLRHDAMLAATPLVVIAGAIVLTVLVLPTMNYRGPQVTLAVFWVGAAGLIDRALTLRPRVFALATCAALLLTTVAAINDRTLWPLPARYDFRSMGSFLAAQNGCHGRIMPVIRVSRGGAPASDLQPLNFLTDRYGYYGREAGLSFGPIFLIDHRFVLLEQAQAELRGRATGTDACPVMAVMAGLSRAKPADLEKAMRELTARLGGNPAHLRARWFTHYAAGNRHKLRREMVVFYMDRRVPLD